MKNLVFMLVFTLGFCQSLEARHYEGSIDFSSNSVTTTYEAVLTSPKKVRGVACQNTSDTTIRLGRGQLADCSDATTWWDLLASGNNSFAFDDYEVPAQICAKTLTGTVTSGDVNCKTWLEGATQ